jgi:hypothetical protein
MIPYPELERALKRWKVRQEGGAPEASFDEQADHEVTAEAVVSEAYAETEVAVEAPAPEPDPASLIPVVEFDTGQK